MLVLALLVPTLAQLKCASVENTKSRSDVRRLTTTRGGAVGRYAARLCRAESTHVHSLATKDFVALVKCVCLLDAIVVGWRRTLSAMS